MEIVFGSLWGKMILSVIYLSSWTWLVEAQGTTCINSNPQSLPESCESIADTSCSQFYSHSIFPNNVTTSLTAASLSLTGYQRFLRDCSSQYEYVHAYLCLSLIPRCDPEVGPRAHQGPCRSLCELVRSSCHDISSIIGETQDLNCLVSSCTRFPTENCIDANHTLLQQMLTTPTATPTLQVGDNSTPSSCPLPNDTFFSESSKSFAVGWISFWSVLCFLSTTITICTFLLDTSRFQYPWRPVVYLALAFNMHSLAYFLSLALGRTIITCPNNQFVHSGDNWTWAHTPCILVFMFLYYSMMVAFIWWVVLTICWFLVSALKWSHEAVSKFAPFFQVSAWVIPLVMTICLLAGRVIGADELTATCFVVNDGSTSGFLGLLIGVILPLILFLGTGIVFLLLGFISIMRIRAFMRKGGKQQEQESLEKLMIRIGIFVAVYIVPASVLIGCFVYELASRSNWQALNEPCVNCTRPNSAVFMVRIFMFLLIGALTGIWIWSRKTLKSWQQLPEKCVVCCTPPQDKNYDIPVTAIDLSSTENVLPPRMPSISRSYPDSKSGLSS